METDLSGTPGGAQLRKQEAEMVGSGERGRSVACVQNYTGNRKQQWLCILGQVWGLLPRGLCQKAGTEGQGLPKAVCPGSRTPEQRVLRIFPVFAECNQAYERKSELLGSLS